MTIFSLMLAATVVFPPSGKQLPAIDTCYMIGTASRGVTNLTIQGRDVSVYRTHGWVTMLDNLLPGTNTIEIIEGGKTNYHSFVITKKVEVVASKTSTNLPPVKVYEKLPYAGEKPVKHLSEKNNEEIVVYLDPGHGGQDTGALGPHGFPEKDANLRVAFEARDALLARGFNVKMTRESDVAIDLYERAKDAHQIKADAFISIHHNAPGYTKDPRETRYHIVYAWNELGDKLAKAINDEMAITLEGDIPSKGIKRANYAVTRSNEIPSCLIEVDFLTTPKGEEDVWCVPRRRAIGEAIARGIENWVKSDVAKD